MMQFYECPYCNHIIEDNTSNDAEFQYDLYEHLAKHDKFKSYIKSILNLYPNIKSYVQIKYDDKFNKNRNTHQFIQILYHYKNPKFFQQLLSVINN